MNAQAPAHYPIGVFALNLWPTFHLLAVALIGAHSPLLGIATLYLLPPILARIIIRAWGKPIGIFPLKSRAFLIWWSLASLQIVFVRLPFLEELLRMFPTLYSNWLRLWGSRIGRLVYWSPATVILDRSYLEIGDNVVLGIGSKLCPHHIEADRLWVAPVQVGDRALVGGYNIVLAGCQVGPGESTPGTLKMRPFSQFSQGKLRRANQDSALHGSNSSG